MKIKLLLLTAVFIITSENLLAQKNLTLEEAVNLALTQSDQAKLSEEKVNTAQHELQVIKNNQYPDFDISGKYSYLSNADVDLQINTGQNTQPGEGSAGGESPKINQLLLGQANLSMPLFAGFKVHNAVKAGENNLKAAEYSSLNENEKLALETIVTYVSLYKAKKVVDLIEESQKNAAQRVKDFTAMEKNGLLARNDLLKAQLQESNVQLSLEEARKNAEILNYRLITLLKLPEETRIHISEADLGMVPSNMTPEENNRKDLEALKFQAKAAQNGIKFAKGDYYPSIAIVGGYMALDVQNALSISNAMNIGVGVSYNLAEIFKNKSDVKVAESKARELEKTIDIASDKIKIQVRNAEQDYDLALRKLEVYTTSVQQAVENYRIVKDKYDNGLVDTNDLLEADLQQLQTKLEMANAKAGIIQKYFELLGAQGNLINKFKK